MLFYSFLLSLQRKSQGLTLQNAKLAQLVEQRIRNA